jgi:phytoene dehydrogenase-like protein
MPKDPESMFYATQDGKAISEKLAEKIIDEIHEEIDDLEDKIDEENKSSLGF